jgi:hypothetical protein
MAVGSVSEAPDAEITDHEVISEESQELDAFIDGKPRPSHLDKSEPVELSDLEED